MICFVKIYRQQPGGQPHTPPPQQHRGGGGRSSSGGAGSSSGGRRSSGDGGRGRHRYNPYWLCFYVLGKKSIMLLLFKLTPSFCFYGSSVWIVTPNTLVTDAFKFSVDCTHLVCTSCINLKDSLSLSLPLPAYLDIIRFKKNIKFSLINA